MLLTEKLLGCPLTLVEVFEAFRADVRVVSTFYLRETIGSKLALARTLSAARAARTRTPLSIELVLDAAGRCCSAVAHSARDDGQVGAPTSSSIARRPRRCRAGRIYIGGRLTPPFEFAAAAILFQMALLPSAMEDSAWRATSQTYFGKRPAA